MTDCQLCTVPTDNADVICDFCQDYAPCGEVRGGCQVVFLSLRVFPRPSPTIEWERETSSPCDVHHFSPVHLKNHSYLYIEGLKAPIKDRFRRSEKSASKGAHQ